jgi:hypothetical protein
MTQSDELVRAPWAASETGPNAYIRSLSQLLNCVFGVRGRMVADTSPTVSRITLAWRFCLSPCFTVAAYDNRVMSLSLIQLNPSWNADPDVPDSCARIDDCDVVLRFNLNAFEFPEFMVGENGVLPFVNSWRFRLGGANDEGWSLGQCRFSALAPEWGEFYAVVGDSESTKGPEDWVVMQTTSERSGTHFLFYFRDNTFECVAEACVIEPTQENSLFRAGKSIPRV